MPQCHPIETTINPGCRRASQSQIDRVSPHRDRLELLSKGYSPASNRQSAALRLPPRSGHPTPRTLGRKDTAHYARPQDRSAGGSEGYELARLRAENARQRGKGSAARTRNLAPGSRLFCERREVKTRRWDFISDHRAEFGVQRLCRVLGASRSGYYRHLATRARPHPWRSAPAAAR